MAKEKFTAAQAEAEILAETLRRQEERVSDESLKVAVVMPAEDGEEIRRRVERASALSGNSMLRVGQEFLNETDTNKH